MLREGLELRRVRRVYFLVTALAWFAAVLPMAVSVLFAQARGFTILQVGLYTGLYALTVALLELPTGGLADSFGRKRTALLAYAFSLAAAGVLLFAFSLPLLLAYAVLHGASRALGSGALQAWFIDRLQALDPDVDLQPPLALAGAFELVALAAATLIGGALPTLFRGLPADGTAVLTPLATPILASMAMTVVLIVVVAWRVREAPNADPGPTAPTRRFAAFLLVLRDGLALARDNPTLRPLLGVEALGGLALTGVETFWQPFFADRLGPDAGRTWLFGVLLAGCFAAGMLGNLASIPATRWLGKRHARVAALFQALRLAALLVLAVQRGAVLAAGFFWLTYFAHGSTNSPLATLFNLEVPSHRRSVMLSLQSMAGFLGSVVGSLLLGGLAQLAGIGVAWVVAAVVAGASVLLLLRIDRQGGRAGVRLDAPSRQG